MADKTGYIGRNPGDSSVTIARQTFTPTSDTKEFTFTAGYTVGLCDVYLNGVKLVDTRDYEANTGSTVGLTSEAVSGDIVEIIAYKAFNLGEVNSTSGNFTVNSALSVGSTATLSGVTTCEGDLYVGGDLYVLDDIVYDEVSGRNLNITGIASAAVIHAGAGATVLSSGNAEFVGIVTSNTCFKVGNGAFGAGIGATITGDGNAVFAGVVPATTFKGDGSALTGVAATDNINTNNIKVSGISTLGHATGTELKITGISTFAGGDIQIDGSAAGVSSVTWDASANSLIFKDESYAKFGDGSDLSIYHQNGSSLIANTTGQLLIRSSTGLQLGSVAGEVYVAGTENGPVDLYNDNTRRLTTTSAGAAIIGVCSATSYTGDGSSLTGIAATSNINTNNIQVSGITTFQSLQEPFDFWLFAG